MKTSIYTNLTYLTELSNGSNEFILQMISLFITTIPEMVIDMEKSLSSKEWQKLRFTAHKMKPAISFMGIKELEQEVVSLEEYASKEIKLDELPKMIEKIKLIIPIVIEELEAKKIQFI